MDLREHQAIKGELTIVLRDEHGREVERRKIKNLITVNGRKLLADLLMGKVNALPSRWSVAVGTGTTAPTVGDKDLERYVDSADDTSPDVEIIDGTGGPVIRITVTATLQAPPANVTQALTEAGIRVQLASAAPILFNRVQFAPINRSGNMVMTLMWEIAL